MNRFARRTTPAKPVRLASTAMTRRGRVFGVVLVLAVVAVTAGCSSDSSKSSSSSSTRSSTSTRPSTTTTTSPLQNPNAKLSAAEIKQLQADLNKVGCFNAAQDGVIGPVTRAAIAAFQKAENLPVDGQYGPMTKAKLTSAVASNQTVCTSTPTTTVPPAGPPCTSAAIAAAVPGDTVLDFGCNSGWAWAGIDTGGPDGYESIALLKANGTSWARVDRATYCVPASNIPPDIYTAGCTTS